MKAEFWAEHVAALWRGTASISAYAKEHGLAVKSLYYWQRKLKAATVTGGAVSRSSKFVALRVTNVELAEPSVGCVLILTSGLRLEMSVLPAPEWLAAVGQAVQGIR